MATPFGTLIERLVGAQVYFAPDGALIGATSTAISAVIAPATPATSMLDYNLGRINTVKYDQKTKDRTREWAAPTGGYKERTDKVVISDSLVFTCIEYAPQLYDQLMFGTAALAAVGSQTLWEKANRYKDGWAYIKRINEANVSIGLILAHVRLSLDAPPEDKNEPGNAVWRMADLADAGALATITFAVG
jgi:hypothetical protein